MNDNTAGLLYKDDPRLMIVRLEDFSQRPRLVIPAILAHVGLPTSWNESAHMLFAAAKELPPSKTHRGLYRAAVKAKEFVGRDLLDHLISPDPNSTLSHKVPISSSWPFGGANNGLNEHDKLRRRQISQPLNPVVAKWPKKMTPEDKVVFKADPQAMKLLNFFDYEKDDIW